MTIKIRGPLFDRPGPHRPKPPVNDGAVQAIAKALTKNGYGTVYAGRDASNVLADYLLFIDRPGSPS